MFQPGGLFRLTRIPSAELNNSYLDASLVFGNQIHEVHEQLSEAGNYQQMESVVDHFISFLKIRFCIPLHPLNQMSHALLEQIELPVSVTDLASLSCLSIRQYERLFLQRMGVSPQYFLNLIKFENTFRMKNMFPHLDWLSIAIHCGYHDYQHLSKAFQKMTQKTPKEFHLQDMQSPERKFGVADTY